MIVISIKKWTIPAALALCLPLAANAKSDECGHGFSRFQAALVCLTSGPGKCDLCKTNAKCKLTRAESLKIVKKAEAGSVAELDSAGSTPLQFVLGTLGGGCKASDPEVLKVADLLLANKASVNAKGANGLAALHNAVVTGNLKAAKYLVAKGADIDALAGTGPFSGMNYSELGKHLQRKARHPKVQAVVDFLDSKKK